MDRTEWDKESHRYAELIYEVLSILYVALAIKYDQPERATDFGACIFSEVILKYQPLIPRWAVRMLARVTELSYVAVPLVSKIG